MIEEFLVFVSIFAVALMLTRKPTRKPTPFRGGMNCKETDKSLENTKKSVTLQKKMVGTSTIAGGAVRQTLASATPMTAESLTFQGWEYVKVLLQRPFVKSPMGVEETLQTLVGKELWIDNQRWGIIERCEKCGVDLMYMLCNDSNTYYISLKLALSLAYKGVCKWVDMDAERCLCVMRVYKPTEDKI